MNILQSIRDVLVDSAEIRRARAINEMRDAFNSSDYVKVGALTEKYGTQFLFGVKDNKP